MTSPTLKPVTPLRVRMIEDMRLAGLALNTQMCYVGAAKNISRYYMACPSLLTQEQVRSFFIHLVQEKNVAESTLRMHKCAAQFLFNVTLKKNFELFCHLKSKRSKRLPVILSIEEVQRILSKIRNPKILMCLKTIYGCGLRLSEGTRLSPVDIDGKALRINIHSGKGKVDRSVPVSEKILNDLRDYWRKNQPKQWFFYGSDLNVPLTNATFQRAFKIALRESGVAKDASIHSLRHAFATHLLEKGVSIRVIQGILGHANPGTTAIYTHLTDRALENARDAIEAITLRL